MAGNKRSIGWDVSEVEESNVASVHGVPINVSPVKKSRKDGSVQYFEGEFADDKKAVRMVSFDTSLHRQFKKAEEEKSVLSLSKCKVKPSQRNSGELEIVMSSSSKVEMSPRKYSLIKGKSLPKDVLIKDVVSVPVKQAVSVTVKLTGVEEKKAVTTKDGKELEMQDVNIADSSGACRMVVWELAGCRYFEEGKCYHIDRAIVKKYGESKYFIFGRDTVKDAVEDIGEVEEKEVEDDASNVRCVEGEICCVMATSQYASCKFCNCKVQSEDGVVGRCTKCSAVFKISKCAVTANAKVVISDGKGKEYTATIFEPTLSRIVAGISGESLEAKLVMAPTLKFKLNHKNVVFAVAEVKADLF